MLRDDTALQYLSIDPEVREALSGARPVVALESAIISHGMPYPDNVETSREIQKIIRECGAIPAIIAIAQGDICIGLPDRMLEHLGTKGNALKVSRRDIPVAVAKRLYGGTTVSATMFCASLAGIRVFVTGGIGGVHRGATQSFDISADLTELSVTPVAVVCAGAKSVLDLALTCEYLETFGVPLLGYRTDELPSFYSRRSGLPVDYRADCPGEVAGIMRAKWDLGLRGGIVIANPIPEDDEIPYEEIESLIGQAVDESAQSGVRGKDLTPFLLERLSTLTDGRTLKANKSLIKNNAAVGSAIAVAYNALKTRGVCHSRRQYDDPFSQENV